MRVLLVDQSAVAEAPELVDRLRAAHAGARAVLLARGAGPLAPGRWDAVVRRPVRIGDVVAAVRRLVPPGAAGAGA